MTEQRLARILDAIQAQRDTATDAVASLSIAVYPSMRYTGTLISAGTRINWGGVLKRAAVDLWDNEGSNPDNAPTLWEDVEYKDGYRIIPETISATLAFSAGEIGYWTPDERFYRAINNGTVWTPAVNPASWEVVE